MNTLTVRGLLQHHILTADLPDLPLFPLFKYTEAWKGDWRVATETALESEHVPHVHPETLGKMGLAEDKCTLHPDGSISTFKFKDETRRRMEKIAALFGNPPRCGDYVSVHLLPGVFLTSTFGLTYSIQRFSPSNFGGLWFDTLAYTTSEAPRVAGYHALHEAFSRQVHMEDRQACASVPEYRQGALLPGEYRLAYFRDWLGRKA